MHKVILIVLSVAVWGSSGQQETCNITSKYYIPNFTANWYRAFEYCNYQGMRLAVIPDENVQSEVVEVIKTSDKFDESITQVWIGASDLSQESVFHWHATGQRVQYSNWQSGNPDNWEEVEHCVEIKCNIEGGWNCTWNDDDCTEAHYFICENMAPAKDIAL